MSNSNTALKVTAFAITVQSPMHKAFLSLNNKDSHYWKEKFTYLRQNESNPEYKKNYDRCHLLLNIAAAHCGTLTNVSNTPGGIRFTFEFKSINELIDFQKKVAEYI